MSSKLENREVAIGHIAKTLSKSFGFNIPTNASTEVIMNSIQKILPLDKKSLSNTKETFNKTCYKILELINKITNDSIDIQHIDEEKLGEFTAEKLYALSLAYNNSYKEILEKSNKVSKNLKKISKNLVRGTKGKNKKFHKQSVELLDNWVHKLSDVKDGGIELIKRFANLGTKFSSNIHKILNSTVQLADIIKKVNDVSNNVNLTLSEIKNIALTSDPLKSLAEKFAINIKSLDSGELAEYLKTYAELSNVLTEKIKIAKGSAEPTQPPVTTKELIEERFIDLEKIILGFAKQMNNYMKSLKTHIDDLIIEMNNNGIKVNNNITEMALLFDENIKIDSFDDYYTLSGILIGDENIFKKNLYINCLGKLKTSIKGILDENAGNKVLTDFYNTINSMYNFINTFSTGDNIKSGSFDNLKEFLTSHINLYKISFAELRETLVISVRKAILLKKFKKQLDFHKQNYDGYKKVLTKSVVEYRKIVNNFFGNGKISFDKVSSKIKIGQNLIKVSDEFKNISEDLKRKFVEAKYEAIIGILDVAESLDYYYQHFLITTLENPDSIKAIILNMKTDLFMNSENNDDKLEIIKQSSFRDENCSNEYTENLLIEKYNTVKSAFDKYEFKNLISIMVKLTNNDGKDFVENSYKSPVEIYEALVNYIAFKDILIKADNEGENVVSKVLNSGVVVFNNADYNKNIEFNNLNFDRLFSNIIYSMLGKILVSFDTLNVLTKNTFETVGFSVGPARLFLGGVDDNIKIDPKLMEIYIRVPLLMKLYKECDINLLDLLNDPAEPNHNMPNLSINSMLGNHILKDLYTVCNEKKDYFMIDDMHKIIKSCNILYEKFKNSSNVCSDILNYIVDDVSEQISYIKSNSKKLSIIKLKILNNNKLLDMNNEVSKESESKKKIPYLKFENLNENSVEHNDDISEYISKAYIKLNTGLREVNNKNNLSNINELYNINIYIKSNLGNFTMMNDENRLKFLHNTINNNIYTSDIYKKIAKFEMCNLPTAMLTWITGLHKKIIYNIPDFVNICIGNAEYYQKITDYKFSLFDNNLKYYPSIDDIRYAAANDTIENIRGFETDIIHVLRKKYSHFLKFIIEVIASKDNQLKIYNLNNTYNENKYLIDFLINHQKNDIKNIEYYNTNFSYGQSGIKGKGEKFVSGAGGNSYGMQYMINPQSLIISDICESTSKYLKMFGSTMIFLTNDLLNTYVFPSNTGGLPYKAYAIKDNPKGYVGEYGFNEYEKFITHHFKNVSSAWALRFSKFVIFSKHTHTIFKEPYLIVDKNMLENFYNHIINNGAIKIEDLIIHSKHLNSRIFNRNPTNFADYFSGKPINDKIFNVNSVETKRGGKKIVRATDLFDEGIKRVNNDNNKGITKENLEDTAKFIFEALLSKNAAEYEYKGQKINLQETWLKMCYKLLARIDSTLKPMPVIDFYEIFYLLNDHSEFCKLLFVNNTIQYDYSNLTKSLNHMNNMASYIDKNKHFREQIKVVINDLKETSSQFTTNVGDALKNNIFKQSLKNYYTNHKEINLITQFTELYSNFIKNTSCKLALTHGDRNFYKKVYYNKLVEPIINGSYGFDLQQNKNNFLSDYVFQNIKNSVIIVDEKKDDTPKNLKYNIEVLHEKHRNKINHYIYHYKVKFDDFYKKLIYFKDFQYLLENPIKQEILDIINICINVNTNIKTVINELHIPVILGEYNKDFISNTNNSTSDKPFTPISALIPILQSYGKNGLHYASRAIFNGKTDKDSLPGFYDIINNYNLIAHKKIDNLLIEPTANILLKCFRSIFMMLNQPNKTIDINNKISDSRADSNTKDLNYYKNYHNPSKLRYIVCPILSGVDAFLYTPDITSFSLEKFEKFNITEAIRVLSETRYQYAFNEYKLIFNNTSESTNKLIYYNILEMNLIPFNMKALYRSVLFSNINILSLLGKQVSVFNTGYVNESNEDSKSNSVFDLDIAKTLDKIFSLYLKETSMTKYKYTSNLNSFLQNIEKNKERFTE